ncbi:spore coat polysaccharide biosynthesis protein SpsF [Bacillus oleivorans]|uniref:Spore coat polysaccharide biosynthesis protein SpsF n=1 Tax=Bacillus oleivorans TaxID=1448271 RepID=A0A285D4X0_9BACI|nr:glycosyltransferase family protein [Bacillus oleivorans]SNX74852.1 spore coat polysaccharide biosynthesis protein SpsF [Bacillus oleivorans]
MILAIIQARVSSSRLPGKVLKPIIGLPLILRQIERVKRSNYIDYLLVATSREPSDDPIEHLCKDNQILLFRGELDNVLDRFYHAALAFSPAHIVRLTGDCPLSDPELIDHMIEFHLHGNFDYTSNTIEPTFPDGLDVEVFRFTCLQQAWKEAALPYQKEHVTPFIYELPDRFKLGSYKNLKDLSHLRWTVDEPADFKLVKKIYEALYPVNPLFNTEDILVFLESHPDIQNLNKHIKRNEGLKK